MGRCTCLTKTKVGEERGHEISGPTRKKGHFSGCVLELSVIFFFLGDTFELMMTSRDKNPFGGSHVSSFCGLRGRSDPEGGPLPGVITSVTHLFLAIYRGK